MPKTAALEKMSHFMVSTFHKSLQNIEELETKKESLSLHTSPTTPVCACSHSFTMP